MNPSATCRAAVMSASASALELREFPIPAPAPREALVRVRCCTVCRSDLHTWTGKRSSPLPVILGHEIVGEVAALGSPLVTDAAGEPLAVGDRVTWTLHSCCGDCVYCRQYQLPMKCMNLSKYGHDSCETYPHLRGGFSEYCLIDAGTALLKLPDNLSYTCAAPLNCAAATVVAGLEAAALQRAESVLIQGAGGLGCYAAAFARILGAKQVIALDLSAERLEFIKKFGATSTLDVSNMDSAEVAKAIGQLTDGHGADCCLELAGVASIVPVGLGALRKGGRYIEIGCSFPRAMVSLDLSQILWNLLTIRGVHNYDFRHLQQAVQFVSGSISQYPFDQVVTHSFKLDQINDALACAQALSMGKVAIVFD